MPTSVVTKIQPLGNRILVKRFEAKTSRGGILLPDTAKEKPRQGEVVAAGPGKYDEEGTLLPMDVKVGDKVLFTSYAGCEVKTEEEGEYLIMSVDDLLAVIS